MVINQFHSIGDLMYIEPIIRAKAEKEKVFLPVADHLFHLCERMYAHIDNLHLVKKSHFKLDYDSMEATNADYLPLRFASQILNGQAPDDFSDYENMMPSKYLLAGMDPEDWRGIKLSNLGKSSLQDGKYVLINEHCGAGSVSIKPKGPGKKVYTEIYGDVIDWAAAISEATSFHTVSTCFLFMLQAMHNEGMHIPKVYVYPRPNEDGLRGVSMINFDYEIVWKS